MRRFVVVLTVLLLVLFATTAVLADGNAYGHDKKDRTGGVSIQVGSEDGSATWTPDPSLWQSLEPWQDETGKWHDEYVYTVTSPIELRTTEGILIGYIDSLDIYLDEDPVVSLGFSCRAYSKAATFNFNSYLVPTMTNADMQATAGVTVTDNNNNGATLTGLYPDNKAYRAWYNGATTFAHLVPPLGGAIVAPVGGTNAQSESTTWQNVGPVTRMDAQFSFTLSAMDSASGTSNYQAVEVPVPEPSGLLAIGAGLTSLAGMMLRRRRG